MPRGPLTQVAPGPGPRDRAREALVVLPPACVEVLDEVQAALPVATFQVALAERAKEQLGLVEPRGVRRCDDRSHVRVAPTQPERRLLRNVRRATVPDQVNASGVAMCAEHRGQDGAQVFAVVPLDAEALHLAGEHDEYHDEVHGPVPDVLELLALDLAGAHRMRRASTLKNLQVRLLVEAEHNLALFRENRDIFG